MTKRVAKSSVQYTDHAHNHSERCGVCKYFVPLQEYHMNVCTKVKGSININGWCELFEKSNEK